MKSRSISLQKMIQPFSSVSTLSTVPTHELICTHLNHKIDWHIVHCFGSSHLPVVVLLPIRRLVGSAAAPSSLTVLRKPSGTDRDPNQVLGIGQGMSQLLVQKMSYSMELSCRSSLLTHGPLSFFGQSVYLSLSFSHAPSSFCFGLSSTAQLSVIELAAELLPQLGHYPQLLGVPTSTSIRVPPWGARARHLAPAADRARITQASNVSHQQICS